MKVLHVLSSLDQHDGGPIRAVLELSAGSLAAGLDSHMIGAGRVRIHDNPLPPDRIHTATRGFPGFYRYSPDLRAWLRSRLRDFDGVVIHGMWLYPGMAAAIECARAGVPYACFPHGMLDTYPVRRSGMARFVKKSAYWHAVESRIFARSAAVLFTTEREMRHARETFRISTRQFIVTPYGIGCGASPAAAPENPALVQPPSRRIALFLGRIHPKKNLEFLLRAWNAAAVPDDYHLVIAGPGESSYIARLRNLALDSGRAGRVHLTGYVAGRDKSYLLGRAQWFVLPSLQENFGVAVLEAVDHGCAVALSDQVYLADYLSPDAAVLPLRLAAWVDFFERRMADDTRRQQTASADASALRRRCGLPVVNERWVKTLKEIFA